MLAKQQHVPLGIEYAGPKLFDLITLRLGPTDLGTIMESLFPSNTGFEVRTQNGVLVITDRAVSKNKTNILDTKLSNFSIPRCSIQRAYVLLSTQLRRQLSPSGYDRGVAGSISGEGSTEIEAFVLTDATVREALNRIVTERKDAAWIVQVRPELLVQTNDGDVEKRFANGNLALWTIVEYDSSLMNNVGKVIKAHALATLQ
jgi:hypothetical protein